MGVTAQPHEHPSLTVSWSAVGLPPRRATVLPPLADRLSYSPTEKYMQRGTRPWAVAAVGLVSVGMTLFFFANLVYQGILAPMWTADSDEPGEWGSYDS